MKKNNKVLMISLFAIVVVAVGAIFMVHNQYTDRVNPMIKETVSYGKVPTTTQQYKAVKVYNPDTKKTETIDSFNGYTNQPYIKMTHKGQYVKSIEYISHQQYKKVINQ